jgi:chromosome segregation ATPase
MVQPGVGLDTPRTNLGDATFLTQQPDFDISQEQSFQSPSKDNNNLIQQLQNGRRGALSLKTPRSRAPFGDRKNIPNTFAGGEFTPLLKSATRNSTAFKLGKENGAPRTPAFLKPGGLDNIAEDLSPVPNMGSSIYGEDSRNASYVNGTPVPQIDSSSMGSTPMALLPRRTDANVLQDGNQLSLREQENVIDKIEKENFGLKLKIHFLEEALRKAGPGFSELALKENTELKVDKVTMQKELLRYRKTLTGAERELESYRQQILEMQEKMKRKHADDGMREELELLRRALQDKEIEVQGLLDKIQDAGRQSNEVENLRDTISDLEAEVREKDRLVDERDDEVENLKGQINERDEELVELEDALKAAKRREIELEEKAQANEELEEAKETIADLEQDIKRLKIEVEEAKDDRQEALHEKERAAADLEELQDEMANKSITTKGLSRQIEEKANRLQDELDDLREAHRSLEEDHDAKAQEAQALKQKVEELEQSSGSREKKLRSDLESAIQERDRAEAQQKSLRGQLDSAGDELRRKSDEKDLLQVRHDALTSESAGLQRDLARSNATIEDLEDKLDHEKTLSLQSERELRDQYKAELDRLNDEIDDLKADIREKERLYDDDSDKWESERRTLQSQRELAEEQAASLKQTINKLQEVEGNLSSKEAKLQEAIEIEKERHSRQESLLNNQIEDLKSDLESRRQQLEEVRTELSGVREELRLSQRDQKILSEKVEALEDEIEVLQGTLDDENDQANADMAAAREESEGLQTQLDNLKQELARAESGARSASAKEQHSAMQAVEAQLSQIKKNEQLLQDQLAQLNLEMHSVRTNAAEVEAERDEIKSQLRDMKAQGEDTFRVDQEKIELRTAKMRLDLEVRRLRDETRILAESKRTLEMELEREIERGTSEESRLKQKETEYLQREASQKDVIRSLKRQLADLERKAHDLEVSRIQTSSPHSTTTDSTRKSEIIEVRHQLATAHQTLKELRIKLKETERESARNLSALTLDLEKKTAEWESERFSLEHDLQQAIDARSELEARNAASENSITRLKSKMERLERELINERKNIGEDRTLALERHDLHEMLRDAQISAESLELVVKARDATILKLSNAESELRSQLKRLREERSSQRDRANRATEELGRLDREIRAKQRDWEAEKMALTRSVRFPNTSISELRGNDDLVREAEEREKRHVKELRGLVMQIEWLRARCRREESLRADAAYAKKFMLLQVELFGAWYFSLSNFVRYILTGL